ncbi:MAG: dihydroorotate dehydrogenase-like protein [Ichthyobacteriaceae bacterium]|nr:dihydroorotate dehydrogenase-like protein [Ichthyobacteriaceae bacterium]
MDLTTEYLGHKLKNPIIVGSCGLTSSVNKIKTFENSGAAAVVLKSLFEEQVDQENLKEQDTNMYLYPEAADYMKTYTNEKSFDKYLTLIKDAKKEVNIPIFASINCYSAGNWTDYAKKIEQAGADGLELNVSLLPSDFEISGSENEQMYFDIIEKVRKEVSIPIALKMSNYSAGLSKLIKELSWTKNVDAFVLFNRYYRPDINIDTLDLESYSIFTSQSDLAESLRWVLLMSDKIETPIVGNTGIHTGEDVIKQILAGAQAVQVVSAFYENGEEYVSVMLEHMKEWMEKKNYNSIEEFRGILNQKESLKKGFERVQFMKYYGSAE